MDKTNGKDLCLKRTVDSGQKQRIKNSLDDNLCDRNLAHI